MEHIANVNPNRAELERQIISCLALLDGASLLRVMGYVQRVMGSLADAIRKGAI